MNALFIFCLANLSENSNCKEKPYNFQHHHIIMTCYIYLIAFTFTCQTGYSFQGIKVWNLNLYAKFIFIHSKIVCNAGFAISQMKFWPFLAKYNIFILSFNIYLKASAINSKNIKAILFFYIQKWNYNVKYEWMNLVNRPWLIKDCINSHKKSARKILCCDPFHKLKLVFWLQSPNCELQK